MKKLGATLLVATTMASASLLGVAPAHAGSITGNSNCIRNYTETIVRGQAQSSSVTLWLPSGTSRVTWFDVNLHDWGFGYGYASTTWQVTSPYNVAVGTFWCNPIYVR